MIILYIKRKQIPLYIAKLTKKQFIALCDLEDELSPLKIKTIIPDIEDSMVLSLCQFMLGKRYHKIQSKKLTSFSL
jgi:hypothetical protein